MPFERRSGTSTRRANLVGRLRSGLDSQRFLLEIIGAHNLRPVGDEIIHSCPLPYGMHKNGDANPSASFNTQKLVWCCYGCGTGGDIFWLIQNVRDCSQDEAISLLSSILSHVEFSPAQFAKELEQLFEDDAVTYELPSYHERILERWKGVSDYLSGRGVSDEIQVRMKVGLDPTVAEHIDGKWVSQERVVLPHFFKGKLRGWTKRKVDDSKQGVKYLDSPGLPKSLMLYGYDFCDTSRPVIVVESPLSVLKLMSLGFSNVVATLGANVSVEQMNLLRNFDSGVWLFPDGDFAGLNMVKKVSSVLERFTSVYVVPVDDGKDAANYSQQEVRDRLEARQLVSMMG